MTSNYDRKLANRNLIRRRGIIALSAAVILQSGLLDGEENNARRRKRRCWTRPWLLRRERYGCYSTLLRELSAEAPDLYKSFLRMDLNCFNYLVQLVKPVIDRQDTVCREAIHAGQRLAITLRFLATGESFRSLSFAWRVSERSIRRIIPETCDALYELLREQYLKVPRTTEEWLRISNEFECRWNLPHCIGALDGKHIVIRKPRNTGSFFINYKHTFSIVLMALVDADYKFTYIDVGCNGRVSDGGVFNRSSLCEALTRESLNVPEPSYLPGTQIKCNYFIAADDAFALKTYIMKPYPFRNMSKEQRIYNYRLSRGRRIVENAFGILSARFRVFLSPISMSPEITEKVVLASCALHNFLRSRTSSHQSYIREDEVDHENLETHEITEGSWRIDSQGCTTRMAPQAGSTTRSTDNAKEMRETLCSYFNSPTGAVPWQDNMI